MEILGFILALLAIAVPICAFLALSQSNKALREIEDLKSKLVKLHQTQINSLTQDKALEEIEALKSKISKLSLEQRKTQTKKTVDMRSVSQEKSQPVKIEKSTGTPPPIPKTTIEENLVEGTIWTEQHSYCLLYTSPSPRDRQKSRMPSSA